jgi:hypothetical protein
VLHTRTKQPSSRLFSKQEGNCGARVQIINTNKIDFHNEMLKIVGNTTENFNSNFAPPIVILTNQIFSINLLFVLALFILVFR